jgi:hypothetical protein
MKNRGQLRGIPGMKTNMNTIVKSEEKRIQAFVVTFPSRLTKFFAGLLLFIPLTAIAFGIHCFNVNEWPWSDRI